MGGQKVIQFESNSKEVQEVLSTVCDFFLNANGASYVQALNELNYIFIENSIENKDGVMKEHLMETLWMVNNKINFITKLSEQWEDIMNSKNISICKS